jgi:hypothetical protein
MEPSFFCDWDGVPAVLFPGGSAWFVAGGPGGWFDTWREVNGATIGYEGRVMSRGTWEACFSGALARAGSWPEPTPEMQLLFDAAEEWAKHRPQLRPGLLPRQPDRSRSRLTPERLRFMRSEAWSDPDAAMNRAMEEGR